MLFPPWHVQAPRPLIVPIKRLEGEFNLLACGGLHMVLPFEERLSNSLSHVLPNVHGMFWENAGQFVHVSVWRPIGARSETIER